jgi:ribonuclease-3
MNDIFYREKKDKWQAALFFGGKQYRSNWGTKDKVTDEVKNMAKTIPVTKFDYKKINAKLNIDISKTTLQTAFTHKSFSPNNYERLEFLGDAVLDFVVKVHVFNKIDGTSGDLTNAKIKYVRNDYLTDIFDYLELESFVISKCQITSSIKADIVESIIGAIFIESGHGEASKFIKKNIMKL